MQAQKNAEKANALIVGDLYNNFTKYIIRNEFDKIKWLVDFVEPAQLNQVCSNLVSQRQYTDASVVEFVIQVAQKRLGASTKPVDYLPKVREFLFTAAKSNLEFGTHGKLAEAIYQLVTTDVDQAYITDAQDSQNPGLALLDHVAENIVSRIRGGADQKKKVDWTLKHLMPIQLDGLCDQLYRANAYSDQQNVLYIVDAAKTMLGQPNQVVSYLPSMRQFLFAAAKSNLEYGTDGQLAASIHQFITTDVDQAHCTDPQDKQNPGLALLDHVAENIVSRIRGGAGQKKKVNWTLKHLTPIQLDGLCDQLYRANAYNNQQNVQYIVDAAKTILGQPNQVVSYLPSMRQFLFAAAKSDLEYSRGGQLAASIHQLITSEVDQAHCTDPQDSQNPGLALLDHVADNIAYRIRGGADQKKKVNWTLKHLTPTQLDGLCGQLYRVHAYDDQQDVQYVLDAAKTILGQSTQVVSYLPRMRHFLFAAAKSNLEYGTDGQLAASIHQFITTDVDQAHCTDPQDSQNPGLALLNHVAENIVSRIRGNADQKAKVKWTLPNLTPLQLENICTKLQGQNANTDVKVIDFVLEMIEELAKSHAQLPQTPKIQVFLFEAAYTDFSQYGRDGSRSKKIYEVIGRHPVLFSNGIGSATDLLNQFCTQTDRCSKQALDWFVSQIDLTQFDNSVQYMGKNTHVNKRHQYIFDTTIAMLASDTLDTKILNVRDAIFDQVREQLDDFSQSAADFTQEVYALFLKHDNFVEANTCRADLLKNFVRSSLFENARIDAVFQMAKNIIENDLRADRDLFAELKQARVDSYLRNIFAESRLYDFDLEKFKQDPRAVVQVAKDVLLSTLDEIEDLRMCYPGESIDPEIITQAAIRFFMGGLGDIQYAQRQLGRHDYPLFDDLTAAFCDPLMEYIRGNCESEDGWAQIVTETQQQLVDMYVVKCYFQSLSSWQHGIDYTVEHMQKGLFGHHVPTPDALWQKYPHLLRRKNDLVAIQQATANVASLPPYSATAHKGHEASQPVHNAAAPRSEEQLASTQQTRSGTDYDFFKSPGPDAKMTALFDELDMVVSEYRVHLEKAAKHNPKAAQKLGVLNQFKSNLDLNSVIEDKQKIISDFLKNSKVIDFTSNADTIAEKLIRLCKIILSVLTVGVAAIPFAFHSKKYYGTFKFGHSEANRGSRFAMRADHVAEKLEAAVKPVRG